MAKRSYEKSFEELEEIVTLIESGELSLDELERKVKRAGVLIEHCRSQLRKTEEGIGDLLDKLEN